MKISDFVSSISTGLARTNRYSVILDFPSVVNTDGLLDTRTMLMFCDQIQLPGLTVQTNPNRTFGEVRETPYEFNYEPITMSFYVDSKMHVKVLFDDWLKGLQSYDRRTFRYYDQYICPQMNILVQDTLDRNTYQVNLYECYPKSIGAVQMDYAAKDIMKIQVTMVYKFWKSVEIGPSPSDSEFASGAPLQGAISRGIDIPFFEGFQTDINEIVNIPTQYLEDFSTFQSTVAKESGITEFRNSASDALNKIKSEKSRIEQDIQSKVQGVLTGAQNSIKNFFV